MGNPFPGPIRSQKLMESDRLRKNTKLCGLNPALLTAAFTWQTLCQPVAPGREEQMNES
jgi:hypothetical protein